MAVVENTLTGSMSGSIGLVTFQSWKSVYTMRTKPVVQYNPNTPVQAANRLRFRSVREFYAANRLVLGPIMRRMDRKRNPFNAFSHRNMSLWDVGSDRMNIDRMSSMSLGVGDFYFLQSLYLLTSVSDGVVVAVYIPYTPLLGSEQFWLSIIVYNQTTGESWCELFLTDGGQDYRYPVISIGATDVAVVWCCFFSQRYTWMSSTYYALGQYFNV